MNSPIRTYNLIFFSQPLGDFALSILTIPTIMNIYKIIRRSENKIIGIQRDIVTKRIKEIANYVDNNEELCFPTPLLLALNSNDDDNMPKDYMIDMENNQIAFYGKNFANVIDGQHRIEGIYASKKYKDGELNDLEIPVVFVFNPTLETSALIFATINGNQRPVPYSLVADLFELTTKRTPESVAHQLVVELNSRTESPFFKRIKMLGKKEYPLESLSQGTFVRILNKFFSENGSFHNIYLNNQEDKLLSLFIKFFASIKKYFEADWNSPEKSILTRTVGLHAMMLAFPSIYSNVSSIKQSDPSKTYDSLLNEYFSRIHGRIPHSTPKDDKDDKDIYFTSQKYSSNMAGAKELSLVFISPNEPSKD